MLDARPGAGWDARRVHRAALPAADAELLRPDVQQPEGHPVCRRRRLGDLLHGPHPAQPAVSAVAALAQNGPGDRTGTWGSGRRVAVPVLSRPAAGLVGRLAGHCRATLGPGADRRYYEP